MSKPVIISTWSFAKKANDAAWPMLASGGSSLDAVERVCEVVDTDPDVDSVGFGGLPDATGRVSLDGCIMLAPNQCGSVCHIRNFLHPVSIARAVMEKTGHVMLAGDGAESFAMEEGFMPADLLSADAQDKFRKWKEDHKDSVISKARDYHAPRPVDRNESGKLFFHPAPTGAKSEEDWEHDTVSVLALDSSGVLAGACSTSGMPFKMPGRVGDSPIIGHGLYVHPKYGGAAATGTGELIMGTCGSFLAVECMRRGASPVEALKEVLQRIAESYNLRSENQAALIAMTTNGETASGALRSGYKTSLRTHQNSDVIDPDFVLLNDD